MKLTRILTVTLAVMLILGTLFMASPAYAWRGGGGHGGGWHGGGWHGGGWHGGWRGGWGGGWGRGWGGALIGGDIITLITAGITTLITGITVILTHIGITPINGCCR